MVKLQAVPVPPGISWSFDLPDKLKLAIADCITLHSKIDSCLVETLWVTHEADFTKKRELSSQKAHETEKAIKDIVAQIPGAESDAIWPAMQRLRQERNLIAHGVWTITSEGRPNVVWHSKMLESGDYIVGEYFDWPRFDRYLAIGGHLLTTFANFKRLIEDAVEEQKASRVEKPLADGNT